MTRGQDTIIIYHAYDGFLYAPIFLAEELQLFPHNCRLRCRHGDAEVIQALCDHPPSNEKNWFAICDPLSDHLQQRGVTERICLVASIINVAPVWLYNINPKIYGLTGDQDLREHGRELTRIITYPQKTTGYLFGELIRRRFLPDIPNVDTTSFGDEFKSVNHDTLVVTSDILKVVREDQSDASVQKIHGRRYPIIFSYPDQVSQENRPFLFTGLLTLRQEVLEENLDVLLDVMKAIKKSIHFLTTMSVAEEHIEILARRFRGQLEALRLSTEAEQKAHVREALRRMRELNLYSTNLTPDEVAFKNAEAAWKEIRGGSWIGAAAYIQKAPSVFLSPRWLERPELQEAVMDRMPESVMLDHPKVRRIIDDRVKVESDAVRSTITEPKQSRLDILFYLACTAYLPLATAGVWSFSTFFNTPSQSQNNADGNPFAYFGHLLIVVSLLALGVLGYSLARGLYLREYKTSWTIISGAFSLTFLFAWWASRF